VLRQPVASQVYLLQLTPTRLITLMLLIKESATVTVYTGHRRTLFLLPAIISLFIMCVGIIWNNYLIGGRARPEVWTPAGCWALYALQHMAPECFDHWTGRSKILVNKVKKILHNFKTNRWIHRKFRRLIHSRTVAVFATCRTGEHFLLHNNKNYSATSSVSRWMINDHHC